MKKMILILVGIVLFFYSCSKSGGYGGTTTGGSTGGSTTVNCATVTNKAFTADVLPIFLGTCATSISCHASGSANGPGALTNYAQISGNASTIRAAIVSGVMPKTGTLTTAQKNSIICWIDSGTPNN